MLAFFMPVFMLIVMGNFNYPILTWKPIKGLQTNNADPDMASDQGLQCLLTEYK